LRTWKVEEKLVAEQQGNQRETAHEGAQQRKEDIRGDRGGHTSHDQAPGANPDEERDHAEGRDRAPSNRGRAPNEPWLGGG
jgi:hypothetical protein